MKRLRLVSIKIEPNLALEDDEGNLEPYPSGVSEIKAADLDGFPERLRKDMKELEETL